jgi:hypothetical protein
MAAFQFGRRRTRRGWIGGTTLALLVALAVVFVPWSSANLAGSTFNGGDGNLACPTGELDWNCLTSSGPPALHTGTEAFSGQQDNSFGQGTKEDDPDVTLVQGSIPPNKSDLTRFYEASQLISGYTDGDHILLYLAWERTNVLGNANMDFEINQVATPCMDSTGPFPVKCTITRTVNDLLVTYDFTNGGGNPTIGIRKWSGSKWVVATTGVVSESKVNDTTVHDDHASVDLPANTFGEAAIDLTASGVLTSANGCSFGSATTFLKSRSSASFTSEIKDYIAPVSTPLVECKGAIRITKTAKNKNCTDAGAPVNSCTGPSTQAQVGAGFQFYRESNDCTGLQIAATTCGSGGPSVEADTLAGTGTTALTGSGASAVASACLADLTLGTYYVRENAPVSGFAAAATQTVSVTAKGDCGSGIATAATASFTDQPLTNLTVDVSSVAAGASNSKVSCVSGTNPSTGTAIGNSPQPATGMADPVHFAATGTSALLPGTYTCTVVIDP